MAINKGLKSVIICALILGLVLEHVQVEGKTCCPSTTARNIYNACRLNGGSRSVCIRLTGCKVQDGTTCPREYPHLHLLPDSGEPDATKYCSIGCVSSVCDNLNSALRDKDMNIDMDLCRNSCVRFCNGDAVIASVAA